MRLQLCHLVNPLGEARIFQYIGYDDLLASAAKPGVANHYVARLLLGRCGRFFMDAQSAKVRDIAYRVREVMRTDDRIVDPQLDARTIGLELRYCADREFSIGVAAGADKHAVARAALKARYLNVLVTDDETARFLLEEERVHAT